MEKDTPIETVRYENTIIAAIGDLANLEAAIQSRCRTIFLLTGNIFTLQDSIDTIHRASKKVYVDIDLMEGFGKDAVFVDYLHEVLNPDGIVTTRGNLIKKAKSLNLFAIQRIFVFDSRSLNSGIDLVLKIRPDAVEILPGIMPKVIRKTRDETKLPVICGGLILDKEDVDGAIGAGAIAITTSNSSLWNLT